MNFIKSVREFLCYWYLRYLLATELYMVEPWERTVVHILMIVTFAVFWYFNYSIVLYGISHIRDCPQHFITS
ncbi:serine palmitoyltransferase small subunit A [Leptidea sinapis]|uniref:serine palmitoyltransferase small subunit A n=1 Tax=Leptidea sinapis TaxID=189913 RepID=UPI0021C480E0|nr:serine palmitoyltransferase small subunit A [Leptidea sinapis]